MRRLDYAAVNALIGRHTGRIVELDASSFALLLDALKEIDRYSNWHNDGSDLTINEWDKVQEWVGNAFWQLLDIYECNGNGGNGEKALTYAILRDEKASGAHGGSSAAATWNNRTLNTEVSDEGDLVTLSSNQFVPIAGDYRIRAVCPGRNVSDQRVRLYNVTQTAVVKEGQNMYGASQLPAMLDHIFTANGTDSFRIDHYTDNAVASSGLGRALAIGSSEVYSSVLLEAL